MHTSLAENEHRLSLERQIAEGRFAFSPELAVSEQSCFADLVWDWYDPDNLRHKVATKSRLRATWPGTAGDGRSARKGPNRGVTELPALMAEDIKRFIYIEMVMPGLGGGKVASLNPATLVAHSRSLLHLAQQLHRELGVDRWQDVRGGDLECLVRLEHTASLVNKLGTLRAFAAPIVAANFTGTLSFTQADVDNVIDQVEAPDSEGYEPLPDPLFAFLSKSAHEVISGFLRSAGLPVLDNSATGSGREGLKEQLDLYLAIKQASNQEFGRTLRTEIRARTNLNRAAARKSAKEFGIGWRDLRKYIGHVQGAALTILYLYTAMRYSEAASLHLGCIRKVGRGYELFSTLIKHRATNAPVDFDRWVAIPLVRDAVAVLEHLAPLHGSEWLLAAPDGYSESSGPMTRSAVNRKLKDFLREVDVHEVFKDWNVHGHQYRHGLVAQLAAVKTRLPYISMQLKHLTYAEQQLMDDVPDDVTVGYGNLSRSVFSTVVGQAALTDAKYRMAMDLYGEGKHFAGGGAEKHVARTEAFFKGAGLYGDDRRAFIRERALKGIPIVVTGFGVCGKNLADFEKLKAAPPPCYGDLQCNPTDCDNAVVPENRKGAIAARLRKAESDASSAATEYLKRFHASLADRYRGMLNALEPAA